MLHDESKKRFAANMHNSHLTDDRTMTKYFFKVFNTSFVANLTAQTKRDCDT